MVSLRHLPLFTILLVLAACSPADNEETNTRFVTIGTGGVTGVYYPAGGAICRMVNKNRDRHGIRCNVEATGGSVYNTNSLMAGELSAGIAQADVTYKAINGQPPFKSKIAKLRGLLALHSESVSLVARQDAGIKKLAYIRGKRINIGNPGSGNARTAGELLASCNIAKEALALAGGLKAAEMPDAIRDRKLDGYFYVVGHPTANIKDSATSTPINLVSLTGGCIDAHVDQSPYLVKTTIPGGLYRGTMEPVPTFGVKATLVATTDMPDTTTYELVRSVIENLKDFKELHPAFTILTPKGMVEGMTVPLHPGAKKYFQEKGLLSAAAPPP